MTTARGEMARECGGGEVCRGEGPARQSTPACRSQAAGSSARGGAADQAKRRIWAYWRQRNYPLRFDRTQRVKRSLVWGQESKPTGGKWTLRPHL